MSRRRRKKQDASRGLRGSRKEVRYLCVVFEDDN